MKLVCVTASTNIERARPCLDSWNAKTIIVANSGRVPPSTQCPSNWTLLIHDEYLGTVPAFKWGVDFALDNTDADIICALHDDLILQDPDWATKVIRRFEQQPAIGLLGFGGAIGLGDADIYQKPYQPQQLARIGFRSNLQDAEVHGMRSLLAERVACLDGFSLLGRRAFYEGWGYNRHQADGHADPHARPWHVLEQLGIVHHFQDSAMGCIAARYGWETWYLPIRAVHLGGQTAVGDQGYQAWAKQQVEGGDHGFWEQAHQAGYEAFKDVLPLRV